MPARHAGFAGLAVLLALAGCAGAATRAATPPPDWLDDLPDGRCAVGSSGATLRPLDAVRQAEAAARASLAFFRSPTTDLQNLSADFRQGHYSLRALHLVEELLSDVVVVDAWTDRDGTRSQKGSAWSRVCLRSASPVRAAPNGVPAWILNVPRDRTCAVAYCGRTIRPRDQEPNLLESARYRLAETLAVHNRVALADAGDDLDLGAVEDVPEWAVRTAASAALSETWLDAEGRGPLGDPGTLYGLICL